MVGRRALTGPRWRWYAGGGVVTILQVRNPSGVVMAGTQLPGGYYQHDLAAVECLKLQDGMMLAWWESPRRITIESLVDTGVPSGNKFVVLNHRTIVPS